MRATMMVGTLLVALHAPAAAQRRDMVLDASVGASGSTGRAAIAVWRQVLRAPAAVRISIGLRATAYVAHASSYVNRDAVQGGLTASLDIDPGVVGANLAIGGEMPIGPTTVGANLDLAGIAGGSRWRQGTLEGSPQTGSLFLYGAADRGALNSEFYVSIRVGARVDLRAGASHYVTNYTVTDTASTGPTARYQRFETVPFAALRLRL